MSKFSTEEKVRIVLDGMRYPEGITGLCRQVGISRSTYYHWQRTLLERGKEGLISRRNGKVDPQRAKLNQEQLKLDTELRKAEAQELNEERLYEFCRNLPNVLTGLNFEDKRQILREVVDKIVVDGGEVTIYGIIPLAPESTEDASIVLQSS